MARDGWALFDPVKIPDEREFDSLNTVMKY